MVKVVNIVAGGDLGCELDLQNLFSYFNSLDTVQASFDPASSSALQLRFEEEGPLCMIYRTGKFIITGSKSEEQMEKNHKELFNIFTDLDIIHGKKLDLTVYNKVFTEDFDKKIDLSKFSLYVGLEQTEYEPELAPFLTYRPVSIDGVITIASTGKMVINGVRTEEDAERLVADLEEKVEAFLSVKE